MVNAQQDEFGQGACVAMIERNGYNDSDFYGIFAVKDEDGYRFVTKATGSTAYGGGYVPQVDATEDVLVAYRARRQEVLDKLAAEREQRLARVPVVGKTVTVVKAVTRGKNKIHLGAVGEVVWRGEDQYRTTQTYTRYRLGVEFDGVKVFLDDDRVRVLGFEDEDLGYEDSAVDYVIAGAWPAA